MLWLLSFCQINVMPSLDRKKAFPCSNQKPKTKKKQKSDAICWEMVHGLNVTEEQQTRGRLCDFHEWLFTCLCENVHLLWDEMVKLDGRTQLIHSNITFHHIRLDGTFTDHFVKPSVITQDLEQSSDKWNKKKVTVNINN